MSTASVATARPGPMTPTVYRVAARAVDAEDTATLSLAPIDDAIDPPAAGQFNMLWAFGVGEAPISLAGADGKVLHHTIRRAGKVSTALWSSDEGAVVGLRGPYGTGWELSRALGRDLLIVAGGLGLAPLRPLILELLERREEFGRVAIQVGARSPRALLYRDELESWRGRLDLDVDVTVDAADRSWQGDVGMVTRLIRRAPVDPATTTAFVCGPEIMMRFVAPAVVELGVPAEWILLSMERNMHSAVGHCGHCQLGPAFVCKDGPVLPWSTVEPLIRVRER